MKKAEKIALVLALRDAALAIIKESGERGEFASDRGYRKAERDGLRFYLRTPSEPVPEMSERLKFIGALHGLKPPVVLPWGLDIVAHKKVLNLEWDDNGAVHVVGFHRGEWEAQLMAMGQRKAQPGARQQPAPWLN